MTSYTPNSFHLSTVDELNHLSTSQNFLLMLRVLHTSDLAFTSMLFLKSTLLDIEQVAASILAQEMDSNCHHLTPEEVGEYTSLLKDLHEEAQSRSQRGFWRGK